MIERNQECCTVCTEHTVAQREAGLGAAHVASSYQLRP